MQEVEPSSRKLKRDRLTPPFCELPDCDWTDTFQRHRIVPGRDGGKYKLGNVIALCPNHHSIADEGVIPAEYLLEIVKKRIELSALTTESDSPERTSGTSSSRCGAPEESAQSSGDGSADEGHDFYAGITEAGH